MHKENWLWAVIGLLAGIVLTLLFTWCAHWHMMERYGHRTMMNGYFNEPTMMGSSRGTMLYFNGEAGNTRFVGPGMMGTMGWNTTSTAQ